MASRRYSDPPLYELGLRELPKPQFVQLYVPAGVCALGGGLICASWAALLVTLLIMNCSYVRWRVLGGD